MTAFPVLLDKLQRRIDLTSDEAAGAMETIMDGQAQPSQIAGLLVGLAMKGERPDEIVGLARTMRARATKLSRTFDSLFDTCGTGGDGAHTFNVSTVAALVVAACGVHVAKHGNRSASSKCGSADLFETLGVNVTAPPAVIERCLDEISTTGYTKVSECRDGAVNTFYLHPSDVGLAKSTPETLKGGEAADNAAIARAILEGEKGPRRDIVLLNAGASLLVAGRVATVPEGIEMAARAIDSGRAKAVLAALVRVSNDGKVPA